VAARVPGQEHDLAAGQLAGEETVRGRAEGRLDIDPLLTGEAIDMIEAAAADDADTGLRHGGTYSGWEWIWKTKTGRAWRRSRLSKSPMSRTPSPGTSEAGSALLSQVGGVECTMCEPPEKCRFFTMPWGGLVALGLLFALLIAIAVPNFPGPRRSKTNEIINNLRQLDGAVQQWGLDHHQTGVVAVTWGDLAPYLKDRCDQHGWVKSVDGEVYVLKGLAQSPEVVLTRKLGDRPKGTVLRFGANGDDQWSLPHP
jgi:hypothetical protein